MDYLFLFILFLTFLIWIVNIEVDLNFIRKSLKKIQDKEEKIEYKENEELKEALKTFLKDYWF